MSMEFKVRSWLWVVLVAVVLIGGGFTYWYVSKNKTGTVATSPTATLSTAKKSPATDETADWETYNDDTYGYLIKYPQNYKATTVKEGVIAFGPPGYEGPAPLSIMAVKPISTGPLDSFIESEKNNSAIRDCQKTTLANKAAYECLDLGIVTNYILIADNNDYIYELLFNSDNKDTLVESKAALASIQKLMLSTFQFTK